jgi:hypothetical protein
MAIPSDCNGAELHRVVLSAESRGRQQKSQNLRVGLGGPAGHEVEQQEHQQSPEQAVEKVEGGRANAHGEEEEFSLGSEDRQWPGQRPMDSVDSSGFRHVTLLRDARDLSAGKEPRQEIHGGDGHADTEKHAGKHTLRAAFPEGEGETPRAMVLVKAVIKTLTAFSQGEVPVWAKAGAARRSVKPMVTRGERSQELRTYLQCKRNRFIYGFSLSFPSLRNGPLRGVPVGFHISRKADRD